MMKTMDLHMSDVAETFGAVYLILLYALGNNSVLGGGDLPHTDDHSIGCYITDCFQYEINESFPNLTRGACTSFCHLNGYNFAGIRNAAECACACENSCTNKSALESVNVCGIPCPGSPQQTCGGKNATHLFPIYPRNLSSETCGTVLTDVQCQDTTSLHLSVYLIIGMLVGSLLTALGFGLWQRFRRLGVANLNPIDTNAVTARVSGLFKAKSDGQPAAADHDESKSSCDGDDDDDTVAYKCNKAIRLKLPLPEVPVDKYQVDGIKNKTPFRAEKKEESISIEDEQEYSSLYDKALWSKLPVGSKIAMFDDGIAGKTPSSAKESEESYINGVAKKGVKRRSAGIRGKIRRWSRYDSVGYLMPSIKLKQKATRQADTSSSSTPNQSNHQYDTIQVESPP